MLVSVGGGERGGARRRRGREGFFGVFGIWFFGGGGVGCGVLVWGGGCGVEVWVGGGVVLVLGGWL